ncbi:PREDICTED: kinesin-like protein KIN-7N [Camelina sativa]|uniref:Kinesin-like protein n=1 Tax=Camelina sativa TaxID=90675 RepID=A0ABM0WF75_CAMSA|nr:PREDICTED: kinesin-like protein KIN-7N [Camelina sativa]
MEKICVAVRVRPPAPELSPETGSSLWKVEDNRISLHKSLDTSITTASYAFDHVFDESSTNASVYELLTKDIIHAAVEGFNGTAFAYGQTSSGKTFTMTGSETDPGIIRRSVRDVFERIHMISDREFLIRVSYMEIYNEEINDLLAVENQRLQIHEHLERGVFVAGLKEEIVSDAEQILKLIDSGEVNRHFGETNMNVHSSRSHTIFRMVIESRGKDNNSSDAIRVSVLNLVDLAGSERIAKTGAGGVRLTEGKYINKSLMILGNVINKLSDSAKLRAHIPYRDSKLTRILQPALGGNAKTCIICTIAPEEHHIEESKGTLQFASRAKRITNCAQVNEILTDAALLKRQKLEIEELRMKLQGSHAEVLEQEILKLSNQMLKYELECERLKTQLEEERRKQKEQEQCIKEQQMKIENLNNLVTNLDFKKKQSEDFISLRKTPDGQCNNINDSSDVPGTPCFKSASRSFVVSRSNNYSGLSDFSPMVNSLGDVADEDTWMKLNKGFVADLDKLQFTPAIKCQFTPAVKCQATPLTTTTTECSRENYKEVEDLKSQIELLNNEKEGLQVKFNEQVLLNNKLMEEMTELKQETLSIKEIPNKLSKSFANCKDVYKDVIVTMQNLIADKESPTVNLLFGTTEITTSLLSTLETQFSMIIDGQKTGSSIDHPLSDQWETLRVSLKNTTTSLLSDAQAKDEFLNSHNKGQETTALEEEKLKYELSIIKERYNKVEKELCLDKQLLEASRESHEKLLKEVQLLKEDRDSLDRKLSQSTQRLRVTASDKENVLRDLNVEVKRRKEMEEEIKQISTAFATRHKSFVSFHSEIKSKMQKLTTRNP